MHKFICNKQKVNSGICWMLLFQSLQSNFLVRKEIFTSKYGENLNCTVKIVV
jgi:hypothetical protein